MSLSKEGMLFLKMRRKFKIYQNDFRVLIGISDKKNSNIITRGYPYGDDHVCAKEAEKHTLELTKNW